MELEEGDVVLCTVDRIMGTNVFVKIHTGGDEPEGIIMTSEIAAGRIRNLRNYVVPKKRIVCKVLRISGDKIDLSLRRVTQKEQKEVMEEFKLEKSYMNILKTIAGNKFEEVQKKIKEKGRIYDFFEDAKENPAEIEKLIGKENAKKLLEIINTQKQKNFIVKREIILKTTRSNGIDLIKKVLGKPKDVEIKYVSAGHYSLKSESSDVKEADNRLRNLLSDIEKNSKREGMEFSIIEK
jgi:translation initiation factor 2 alpha subunit (eIF-2alpha)